MEENPSSYCFKALFNTLWDLCPSIRGCSTPKTPRAGGHHGQSLSCRAAPNPELWMVSRNWSCLFQLDPGALALLAPWLPPAAVGAELPVVLLPPYTSCTSHISKVRRKCPKVPFQGAARAHLLCFVSLSITFLIWLPWGGVETLGWCGHTPPPLPTMGCAYQDPKWTRPSKILLSCLDAEFPIFPYFTFGFKPS